MTIFLQIVFALLNAADGWTTWQVFRFGGIERNDWIAWCIKNIGLYWALLIAKVSCVVVVWLINYFYGIDWRILVALDLCYAVQIYWNYQQLQKHKIK